MTLSEILKIPDSFMTPASVMYDASDTTFICNIGGNDVYVIPDTNTVIYCIFHSIDKPAIAYIEISIAPTTIGQKDYHQVTNIYVSPAYRGRNLGFNLRQVITKRQSIPLLSDTVATVDGINNLKKTISSGVFDVAYYDNKNKQVVIDPPVDLWTDKKWQVMLESFGRHYPTRGRNLSESLYGSRSTMYFCDCSYLEID